MKAGIMKSCLFLVILVPFLMTIPLDSEGGQYGGVVRIHFDPSPSPDLTTIQDTYFGEGPFTCAHVVIDSMPGGVVSAYHLNYRVVSEDSSIMVLGGFHPRPGWEFADDFEEFPPESGLSEVRTPTSVGYLRLWLRKGSESKGHVGITPAGLSKGVLLANSSSGSYWAERSYNGGVNTQAPTPRDFLHTATRTPAGDWTSVPEISPVWVLRIDGDNVRLVSNQFSGGGALDFLDSDFPIRQIPIRWEAVRWDSTVGFSEESAYGVVPVRADGEVPVDEVAWIQEDYTDEDQLSIVGRSQVGTVVIYSGNGQTRLRDLVNDRVWELALDADYAVCHDLPEKAVVVGTQRLAVDARERVLRNMTILDYEGGVLYELGWTDCDISRARISWHGRLLWYGLTGCPDSGDYLVKLGRGSVSSLGTIPRGVKSLSPDGRSILVYDSANLQVLDLEDPQHPTQLWERDLGDRVAEAVISDESMFVCYALSAESPNYGQIFVVATADGRPLGKLVAGRDAVLNSPFTFIGPFLFTGASLVLPGSPVTTRCVCVFDLRMLMFFGE
jgi:hypothetical protein